MKRVYRDRNCVQFIDIHGTQQYREKKQYWGNFKKWKSLQRQKLCTVYRYTQYTTIQWEKTVLRKFEKMKRVYRDRNYVQFIDIHGTQQYREKKQYWGNFKKWKEFTETETVYSILISTLYTVHCTQYTVKVLGAGIEPAQPQWSQDFKYYAMLQNATKRDKREQNGAK